MRLNRLGNHRITITGGEPLLQERQANRVNRETLLRCVVNKST